MKKVFYVACVMVLCALLVHAQASPDFAGATAVSFGDKKTITALNGFRADPAHCDAAGNIYLFVSKNGNQFIPTHPALKRITPAAAVEASYSAGKGHVVGSGFGQHGEAAILMNRDRVAGLTTGDYLLRFNPQGKLEGESRFVRGLDAGSARLALFPDGNVLIVEYRRRRRAGYRNSSTSTNQSQQTQLVAIYDSQARLVTNVERPGDEAIYIYDAISGPDGNAYLVGLVGGPGKTEIPAIVYAVAPSGKIVKRLEIAPPAAHMLPHQMQVADGRIAIVFLEQGTSRPLVSINDWKTGQRLKLYQLPNKVTSLACYDPATEHMVFLDQTFPPYAANQVSLRVAQPSSAAKP